MENWWIWRGGKKLYEKKNGEEKGMKSMERKFYPTELKNADGERLELTAVISTEKKDRQGDIMRAHGMRTDSDTVPVLFAHGFGPQNSEPIGRVDRLWVDTWKSYPAVLALIRLFPDDLGRRLYQKMVAGFLNSWSIGYIVNDYIPLNGGGRDCKIWTLYETSAVSVPANADTTTLIESGKFQGVQCKFLNPDDQRGTRKEEIDLGTVYLRSGRLKIWLPDSVVDGLIARFKSELK
jgi:hypothetical protein